MFREDADGKWKIENGIELLMEPSEKWLSENQSMSIPTIIEIDFQVINKIRECYDINEELKMINLGISDATNEKYINYREYVTECVTWGKLEKEKYNLI